MRKILLLIFLLSPQGLWAKGDIFMGSKYSTRLEKDIEEFKQCKNKYTFFMFNPYLEKIRRYAVRWLASKCQ